MQVNISAREANRLAVEGRRIATLVPAQPGLITTKRDEATGAMFFAMASENVTGSLTLFVTDDRGTTYKLVVVPRPIAGDEIVLQPPGDKAVASARASARTEGRAPSYQRRIKDLVLVMAEEQGPDPAVEKVDVNKEVPLWQEARLTLVAKYLDADNVGEKYRLTNVSSTDLLLVEQELFRRGVRAVSIKHHTLTPGDSTDIYIVRERKDNE